MRTGGLRLIWSNPKMKGAQANLDPEVLPPSGGAPTPPSLRREPTFASLEAPLETRVDLGKGGPHSLNRRRSVKPNTCLVYFSQLRFSEPGLNLDSQFLIRF